MGHRLSRIYTRTGDKGTTELGGGRRVDKDDVRIEAFGTVDELNSVIGLLLAEAMRPELHEILLGIQHDLFDVGSELCVPDRKVLASGQIERLENILDQHNADLPWLKEFILPGGHRTAALCHLARTVCRRAERRVTTLGKTETVPETSKRYLNRLSDLLFVLARVFNRDNEQDDILWQPQKTQED